MWLPLVAACGAGDVGCRTWLPLVAACGARDVVCRTWLPLVAACGVVDSGCRMWLALSVAEETLARWDPRVTGGWRGVSGMVSDVRRLRAAAVVMFAAASRIGARTLFSSLLLVTSGRYVSRFGARTLLPSSQSSVSGATLTPHVRAFLLLLLLVPSVVIAVGRRWLLQSAAAKQAEVSRTVPFRAGAQAGVLFWLMLF